MNYTPAAQREPLLTRRMVLLAATTKTCVYPLPIAVWVHCRVLCLINLPYFAGYPHRTSCTGGIFEQFKNTWALNITSRKGFL